MILPTPAGVTALNGGFMTAERQTRWLVAALLAMSLLAACGGSDDEPVVKPTSDAPTSATSAPVDADGFTPEQREVADAVVAYTNAVVGRGPGPVEPAIKDLVTPDVLDFISKADDENIVQAGLQYIGTMTVTPTAVTIDGDTARVQGCQDGSRVAIVKKGETQAGEGSTLLGSSTIDYGLVREDGAWLISDPKSTPVTSC